MSYMSTSPASCIMHTEVHCTKATTLQLFVGDSTGRNLNWEKESNNKKEAFQIKIYFMKNSNAHIKYQDNVLGRPSLKNYNLAK